MIECFGKIKLKNKKGDNLEDVFNDAITGKPEGEHRDIATKIALEYHKELFDEMEGLKKQVQGKNFKPTTYISPDKSETIKQIQKEYEGKIREIEGQGTVLKNQPISYDDFRTQMIAFAETQKDSSFEFRLTIPSVSQKDREAATKDIREGKNSKRAQKLEADIKEMYDKGVVSVNRGRGSQAQSVDISLNEWFSLNEQEQQASDTLTDEQVQIINEEGVTLANLDNFKNLFNGFPYEQADYEAIKGYLSGQGKINGGFKPVVEEGETKQEEVDREQNRKDFLGKLNHPQTGDFAIYNQLPKEKRKLKLDAISKRVVDAHKNGTITDSDFNTIQERINADYAELGVEDVVAEEIPIELFKELEGEGLDARVTNKQKAKELADKVRDLRIKNDKLYGGFLGISVAAYNSMLTAIALVIEAGGTVADMINAGVEAVRGKTNLSEKEVKQNVVAELKKIGFEIPEDDFESKQGKKSILNRAFEGDSIDTLKDKIESYGLNYEVQTHDEARKIATDIINELGIDATVDAIRKGVVKGAEAAFVWAAAIDAIGDQIAVTTNETELRNLERAEASLLNEFDQSGRSEGRFISALKDVYATSDFGYKLSFQIDLYKQANSGVMPAEVEEKFRELDKELQDVKKELEAARQREIDQKLNEDIKKIKEAAERAQKRPLSATQTAKKIATALRKGKTNRPGIFMSATPASLIFDTAIEITAKAIEAGGVVADAIQQGIRIIKESDWYKGLTSDKQTEAEKAFSDYASSIAIPIKPKARLVKGRIVIPDSMIRDLVEGGITEINELVAAIKESIKKEFPDVTDREIRDAISKYGKVVNPSQEEIDMQIRKLKRIARYVSILEDIEAKKRPLRSGQQRDKLDAQERAYQKKISEAMKDLPVDEATEQQQLKTTLDAIKTRLRNHIEDIEREIETGEKRAANKGGVADDAEIKTLREELERLRVIRDEIFGNEITEEQRISLALKATERAVNEIEQKIKDNNLSYKKRKTVSSPELDAARNRLRDLRESLKQMRTDAGVAAANQLAAAKKRAAKQIALLQEKLKNKDFAKKERKSVIADTELIRLIAKKNAIQEQFDKERYKAELNNRTKVQKAIDAAIEVWGLSRVLMATGEFSFIMIQGGVYTVTHPINAFQAIKKVGEHFFNEKRFEAWEQHIKAQDFYPALKASKLALSEYDSKLTAREEAGAAGWVNMIWNWFVTPVKLVNQRAYDQLVKANPFKMFERAGVSYMNHMRLMRFLAGSQKLENEGKTFQTHPEDYKAVADAINTFTGRAALGKSETVAKGLALIFFSPRNWASTIIQTVPPIFAYKLSKWGTKDGGVSVAQKMAISDYIKYMTVTLGTVLLISQFLNDDDDEETSVNFDPRSSDFLKIKTGNTRIDPFGGRTQMVVYQTRIILDWFNQDSYTTTSGKTSRLGEGMFTPTKSDLTVRMIQNKLAPTLGAFAEYAQTRIEKGERVNKFGEPYKLTDKLAESSHPIFWQTIKEVAEDQPKEMAAFLITLAAIGTNVQVYKAKEAKKSKTKSLFTPPKPKAPLPPNF